jgi:hypothetical protein
MHPGRSSKIFNKIALRGPEFVGSALGPLGQKLVFLFENLGNHPEADYFFFEDCDLALCDLLDLAEYADSLGMLFFARHLPLLAEAQASKTFKNSKSPGFNGRSARFFRKPVRDKARETRSLQKVCSVNFAKSIHRLWHSLPSDFSTFIKDSCALRPTSDVSKKFIGMGCRSLAAAATEIHERFKAPQCFLGYKKLDAMDACRILAKINRFVLAGDHADPRVIAKTPDGCFEYCPLIVPLHHIQSIPEHVLVFLNDAEHDRSFCFDSAFDNYVVVVPFVGNRHEQVLGECNLPNAQDYNYVLSSPSVCSVLLGERDGNCYFICEWNRLNYNKP